MESKRTVVMRRITALSTTLTEEEVKEALIIHACRGSGFAIPYSPSDPHFRCVVKVSDCTGEAEVVVVHEQDAEVAP